MLRSLLRRAGRRILGELEDRLIGPGYESECRELEAEVARLTAENEHLTGMDRKVASLLGDLAKVAIAVMESGMPYDPKMPIADAVRMLVQDRQLLSDALMLADAMADEMSADAQD